MAVSSVGNWSIKKGRLGARLILLQLLGLPKFATWRLCNQSLSAHNLYGHLEIQHCSAPKTYAIPIHHLCQHLNFSCNQLSDKAANYYADKASIVPIINSGNFFIEQLLSYIFSLTVACRAEMVYYLSLWKDIAGNPLSKPLAVRFIARAAKPCQNVRSCNVVAQL